MIKLCISICFYAVFFQCGINAFRKLFFLSFFFFLQPPQGCEKLIFYIESLFSGINSCKLNQAVSASRYPVLSFLLVVCASCFLSDWPAVRHSAACQREPSLTLTSPFCLPSLLFQHGCQAAGQVFRPALTRCKQEMCNVIVSRWEMLTFAKRGWLKSCSFYW